MTDYVIIKKKDIVDLVYAHTNQIEYSDYHGTVYDKGLVKKEHEIIEKLNVIVNNPTDKFTDNNIDIILMNRELIEENNKLKNAIKDIPSIIHFTESFVNEYKNRLQNIVESC